MVSQPHCALLLWETAVVWSQPKPSSRYSSSKFLIKLGSGIFTLSSFWKLVLLMLAIHYEWTTMKKLQKMRKNKCEARVVYGTWFVIFALFVKVFSHFVFHQVSLDWAVFWWNVEEIFEIEYLQPILELKNT